MFNCVHEFAPAKLNISLKVLPVRGDGFHNIESIFQKIQLCDELTVTVDDSVIGISFTVDGMDLPIKNTVTSAFSGFVEKSGLLPGISVKLKKIIPSGAGMGGGSSDAAAMLRALNVLFPGRVSQAELLQIAESVGSDVPFFLSADCAVVSGRGECIRSIKARRDLCFVVVCPDIHSSTKEAYQLVDSWYQMKPDSKTDWPSLEELEDAYNKPVRQWKFVNSFTAPLAEKYPLIGQAAASIMTLGAGFVDMTGSGSAVFGVFEVDEKAQDAYNRLSSCWKNCFFARPSSML